MLEKVINDLIMKNIFIDETMSCFGMFREMFESYELFFCQFLLKHGTI